MKRTVRVLYHTIIEREQLLARLSRFSFLEVDCHKIGEDIDCSQSLPVISYARDLPTAFNLKQTLSCPALLLFCPPSMAGVLSYLQDACCCTLSLACSSSELEKSILAFMENREPGVRENAIALTKRERQVITLLLSGQDTGSIAEQMGIKRSTVIAHKKHLFLKSGVHSTSQLIVWAMLKQLG